MPAGMANKASAAVKMTSMDMLIGMDVMTVPL
jgi:hypothetical protein